MTNYIKTTKPGTRRRRCKSIIINNPSKPLIKPVGELIYSVEFPDNPPILKEPTPIIPTVTFIMEDRIILEDSSEIFIDAGSFTINIDMSILSKKYPSVDAETGIIDDTKNRYGGTIVQMIMDGLEDVFINEGMARDYVEPELNPAGKKGKGKNKP